MITRYSNLQRKDRERIGYLGFKRLALKIVENKKLNNLFAMDGEFIAYTARYFDVEWEIYEWMRLCPELKNSGLYEQTYALTDFLLYHYNNDRLFFESFLNFCFNKGIERNLIGLEDLDSITHELRDIGYTYDNGILRETEKIPEGLHKDPVLFEENLKKIGPKVSKIRETSLSALFSKDKEKITQVSEACVDLLNSVLLEISPVLKIDAKELNGNINIFKENGANGEEIESTKEEK